MLIPALLHTYIGDDGFSAPLVRVRSTLIETGITDRGRNSARTHLDRYMYLRIYVSDCSTPAGWDRIFDSVHAPESQNFSASIWYFLFYRTTIVSPRECTNPRGLVLVLLWNYMFICRG